MRHNDLITRTKPDKNKKEISMGKTKSTGPVLVRV